MPVKKNARTSINEGQMGVIHKSLHTLEFQWNDFELNVILFLELLIETKFWGSDEKLTDILNLPACVCLVVNA